MLKSLDATKFIIIGLALLTLVLSFVDINSHRQDYDNQKAHNNAHRL